MCVCKDVLHFNQTFLPPAHSDMKKIWRGGVCVNCIIQAVDTVSFHSEIPISIARSCPQQDVSLTEVADLC